MRPRGELTFQDRTGSEVLAEPIPVEIPAASGGRIVIRAQIPALHESMTMTLTILPAERPEGDRELYDGTTAAELSTVERALAGCKRPGCGVPILWLKHAGTGRSAPIDADPASNGNVAIDLVRGEYAVLSGDRLEEVRKSGVELRLNHFVTCANPPGGRR